MGNFLDEVSGPVNDKGREVRVIEKQIPVTITFLSVLFEIFIWAIGFVLAFIITAAGGSEMGGIVKVFIWLCAFIPGIVYTVKKIHAKNYFMQLEQRIQNCASEIGNYQEQRYQILKNVASLVEKSIALDKEVMTAVAAYRSGVGDGNLNENAINLNRGFASLVPHIEAYPELKSNIQIAEAMRQNAFLQGDITAARTLYNENVLKWNQEIFNWPVNQIVAARMGCTTRIPFSVSSEVVEASKSNFFA